MRHLSYIFGMLAAAMLCACSARQEAATDTKESRDIIKRINDVSLTNPRLAMAMADSAEQAATLSPIDVNALRSTVSNNAYHDYSAALRYALKAAADTAIARYPGKHLSVTSMLAIQYYQCGIYDHSIETAAKGLAMAREQGDRNQEASLLLTMALCESEVGMVDKSVATFDRGIKILWRQVRTEDNWGNSSRLVEFYAQKANVLMGNGMYGAVIAMRERYKLALDSFNGCGSETVKGSIDNANAAYYSTYAVAYQHCGDHQAAFDCFTKLNATKAAHETGGIQLVVPYLMAEHRYGEAIAMLDREERAYKAARRDTINYYFVQTLLARKAKALYGEGRYKESAATSLRATTLKASLDRRIKAQGAMWISETLGSKVKDRKISEQRKNLRITYVAVTAMVIILIVVLALLTRVLTYNRIIRRKNIAASKAINDLIAYKEQLAYLLKSRQDKPSGDGDFDEDDHRMFLKLEQRIINDQMFLKPKLSRDEVTAMLGISKNRFASLFTKYSGKSFNKYINDMRLDYAAQQLKQNPAYSVEAIAADCGIPVRQTFYRLFTEKFGLTPAEYRRLQDSGEAQ